jgi:hypothetical protein
MAITQNKADCNEIVTKRIANEQKRENILKQIWQSEVQRVNERGL